MHIEEILKKTKQLEDIYRQKEPMDNCSLSDISITFQIDLSGTLNFGWMPIANSGAAVMLEMATKPEGYYDTQIIFEDLESLLDILKGKIEDESYNNAQNTS